MRPQNWPERLALFHQEKLRQPFAWGSNDCCLFASDWVCILTGKDPAKRLRGAYDSALSAARVLQDYGGSVVTLVDHFAEERGWAPVSVRLARRGDLVAFAGPAGECVGVCDGSKVMFASSHGVDYAFLSKCVKAWRID